MPRTMGALQGAPRPATNAGSGPKATNQHAAPLTNPALLNAKENAMTVDIK